MPVTVPKELARAASQIVTVINEGDREITEKFNGQEFSFPPRSKFYVPAERAWLWFGDPSLRSNATEWDKECARLRNRVGLVDYNYRLEGKFFCKDFGKGREFYKSIVQRPKEVIVAIPLDEEDSDADLPNPENIVQVGPGSELAKALETARGVGKRKKVSDDLDPTSGMSADELRDGIKVL